MGVTQVEERAPLFALRASVLDSDEVLSVRSANFAVGLADGARLAVLVDPAVPFCEDTSLTNALGFERSSLADLLSRRQITLGRTPSCFFGHHTTLEPGARCAIDELYGHAHDTNHYARHVAAALEKGYFGRKLDEALAAGEELSRPAETHTSAPRFDAYCRQSYLDNLLRGGEPVLLGAPGRERVYHLYSRKHGDAERDYNDFIVPPEPYSQGEGSFRDVLQNRREGVTFHPETGDFDVRMFLSLVQWDGYNPRVVKGTLFSLPEPAIERIDEQTGGKFRDILSRPFRPGELMVALRAHGESDEFAREVVAIAVSESEQLVQADFHEGYWTDHWVYLLDLIESYLAIFPDRERALLLEKADIPFFDSAATVRPRSRKYVLTRDGVRQVSSVTLDQEKKAVIAARTQHAAWSRTRSGEVYRTTVFAKLVHLATIKFATLDAGGAGLEMEAGRPGWYDALNGLPSLFGSSFADACELLRLLRFLRAHVESTILSTESRELLLQLVELVQDHARATTAPLPRSGEVAGNGISLANFRYWEHVSAAREKFRERTRLGILGSEITVEGSELDRHLGVLETKLETALRAVSAEHSPPPTYFRYAVTSHEVLTEADGTHPTDEQGRPFVGVLSMSRSVMPIFLEGPVKAMKVARDVAAVSAIRQQVRASDLYDAALGMYKVNAPLLEEPMEIGRAKAFPPGWLENESVWLHMEYKFLLELVRAGLWSEFYEDARTALVPFLDADRYGRSPHETSSFLVSTRHADPSLHGAGFVARLTGANAEFLSMRKIMFMGERPFLVENRELVLRLRPALPGWLFTEDGEVSFRMSAHCTVTYRNQARSDTFGPNAPQASTLLFDREGREMGPFGDTIPSPFAELVRSGRIARIVAEFTARRRPR